VIERHIKAKKSWCGEDKKRDEDRRGKEKYLSDHIFFMFHINGK